MIVTMLQNVPKTAIDMDSAISLALVMAIGALIWKVSAVLTKIELTLKQLRTVPRRLLKLEQHFEILEDDVNRLWATIAGRPADESRTNRYKAPTGVELEEDDDASES